MPKPDWWPDWTGSAVAIIASGPSVKGLKIGDLKGRLRVIAIKQNVDICPWADAVYGCDRAWWAHRIGLPKFPGLKICWRGNGLAGYPDVKRIEIEKNNDSILTAEPGRIGSGGNSGFQALNLAVQFGAKRILLIGFDMDDRSGAHWYGRNNWPMASNPSHTNFKRWVQGFKGAAPELEKMGVSVIDAAANGAIKCFPKKTVDEALKEWGITSSRQ